MNGEKMSSSNAKSHEKYRHTDIPSGRTVDNDNEVKEKFNTKSTDAKDIFNELFGEPKK